MIERSTDADSTAYRQWTSTRLYRELRSRRTPTADLACVVLEAAMPSIETVIASGGTAPLDFTLHDAAHAFRVAETATRVAGTPPISDLCERGGGAEKGSYANSNTALKFPIVSVRGRHAAGGWKRFRPAVERGRG
jgi:hypothetical protein